MHETQQVRLSRLFYMVVRATHAFKIAMDNAFLMQVDEPERCFVQLSETGPSEVLLERNI